MCNLTLKEKKIERKKERKKEMVEVGCIAGVRFYNPNTPLRL